MEIQNNKQIKVNSWVLGILFILSAAVLVLFFGVGYGNQTYSNGKNLTDPQFTGLLLVWLYSLVGICILSVLGFGIASGISNLRTRVKGQKKTGFAGLVFILTFILIFASYMMSSTDPVTLGDSTVERTTWVLKLTDTCMYSIYGLVVVSVLCSILSMLGVFKARR